MSVGYRAVQWNTHKRVYDALVAGWVVLYLLVFSVLGVLVFRGAHALSLPILIMRGLGSCAFILLHVILCIGPLCRLSPRFLPLLYNRRHLGVVMFCVALLHALLAVGFYHGFGHINPLLSLLTSNTNFASLTAFPFQLLGLLALVILFYMAATSHDFWLNNLGASMWKALHMLVYVAYLLIVLHVALGALQTGRGWVLDAAVGVGVALVGGLHLAAGLREVRRDRAPTPELAGWPDAGSPEEIPDQRARIVHASGAERIAVFRDGETVYALTNVCAHQAGPLGEGKIIAGCVTCPWHGWQYRPEDGQSPPPFTERVSTHCTRLENGRILVNPTPELPGTHVTPTRWRAS